MTISETASAAGRTAAVLAHYDRDDCLDPYVQYLLFALEEIAETVVLVSVSMLDEAVCRRLHNRGITVVLRTNEGYDFCSYREGLNHLELSHYDELVLCNDSVYGPITPLPAVFEEMRGRRLDAWGLTENFEIAHHLQSYFLVFNRRVLRSPTFARFWDEVQVLADKREVILRYEVGLSTQLREAGFALGALVSSEQAPPLKRVRQSWRQYLRTIGRRWREPWFWSDVIAVLFRGRQIGVNPTHMEWQALLQDHAMPMLKIELLRDNPKRLDDLHQVQPLLQALGNYPVALIGAHLDRMARTKGGQ